MVAAATLLVAAVTAGLVDAFSGTEAPAATVAATDPAPGATGPVDDVTTDPGEVPTVTTPSVAATPSAAVPGPAASSTGPAAAAPRPAAAEGLRLSVPALGIRTEVLELSPSGGVIDPPRFDVAYVIAPYGRPGSDNTTYIAGHSWARGDAVFNPLLDVPSQQAVLTAGDTVEVDHGGTTWTYRVTDSRRYPKGSLADADAVWAKVPGRLVLITCFQRNDGGASRDNLVVTAELVTGA